MLGLGGLAEAASSKPAARGDAAKAATPPPDGPSEGPPPPYEPQLLRLAEILGALTYLQEICGAKEAGIWRGKIAALIDAEAKSAARRDRLAGAFNRGFRGYELSYRNCTANARAIISRFLTEADKITQEIAHRYGAS